MTNASSNHQRKGSTLTTRRPKSKLRKRRNKEKARARREERRAGRPTAQADAAAS